MNKKFSTLVAGLALCTAFTANAKVENGKLYQLTTGDDNKVLSVVKSDYTKTDSLVLAEAPAADVKSDAYKKSLWKITTRFVALSNSWAYTLTNYGTGTVLSLDPNKTTAATAAGKQAEWNFMSEGAFVAPESVTSVNITAQINKDTKVGLVMGTQGDDETECVALATNPEEMVSFTVSAPEKITMDAALLNNKYSSPFALTFDKNLDGNPIAGEELIATDVEDAEGYVTLQLKKNKKFLVVDTLAWPSNLGNATYWKLTTDALPTENAADGRAHSSITNTVLKNGRQATAYQFKIVLDPNDNNKMIIYPKATPKLVDGATATDKKSYFCYDMEDNTETATGSYAMKYMLAFGNFAGTEKLTIWENTPAKSTFAKVEVPAALDGDYTYYVIDQNTKKYNEGKEKWQTNSKKGQYWIYDACAEGKVEVKDVYSIPAHLWYLDESDATAALKNMWSEEDETSFSGNIVVLDSKENIYSIGSDTLQLVKGPKVVDAQKMGYKVVTRADEVNGALSFRLVSLLANDLYMMTNKDAKLLVANGELADAMKFKVEEYKIAQEEEGAEATADEAGPKFDEDGVLLKGNGVKVPLYYITDRYKKNYLTFNDGSEEKEGQFAMAAYDAEDTEAEDNRVIVAFWAEGAENEYKIVLLEEGELSNNAITANAASGLLEKGYICDTHNVVFEFAKKDAPKYGAPAIGHVQITTLEDDNKMIANQKDGFAALKAEGQSLVDDVYTTDTLTMWLDTACVTFDETMPLYYISTKTFTPEAETRNFLINPANISAAYDAMNEDEDDENDVENNYPFEQGAEGDLRAAFNAASVCGWDSLAIDGDTINVLPLNPAAVAFEVTEDGDEIFYIKSNLKPVNPNYGKDEDDVNEGVDVKTPYLNQTEEGEVLPYYLAQLNNVLFWTQEAYKAEKFVINRASTPTANEGIEAEATVKVIAGEGVVTVMGAAGQNVTIATVLGKVVANETVASDNATIAAPAGVVFVTVNGETTKVVVK